MGGTIRWVKRVIFRKIETLPIKIPLNCFSDLLLHWLHFSLCLITPFWIRPGIFTASHGLSLTTMRWVSPNFGTFLTRKGLQWADGHILQPFYIFAVFPHGSGTAISRAVVGHVIGMSYSMSNSYSRRSWCTSIFQSTESLRCQTPARTNCCPHSCFPHTEQETNIPPWVAVTCLRILRPSTKTSISDTTRWIALLTISDSVFLILQ